jgi:hypothetical protein
MGIINIPSEIFAKENRMRFAISIALAALWAASIDFLFLPNFSKPLFYSICIPSLFCLFWFLLEGSVDIRNWNNKRNVKKILGLKAFICNPSTEKPEYIKDWADFEELYNSEFSEDKGDPSTTETKKWVLKTYNLRKKYKKNQDLDFLIFAKLKSKLCGFLKVTYYYRSNSFAYISYLLNRNNTKNAALIVPEILNLLVIMLRGQLRGCIGVLADTDKNNKKLIDRFRTRAMEYLDNSNLWNLDDCNLEFELPCIKPNDEFRSNIFKPTTLLYVRTKNNPKYKSGQPPDFEEMRLILDFVYNKLYGDSYTEDSQKDSKYKDYLRVIHDRVLEKYKEKQINPS